MLCNCLSSDSLFDGALTITNWVGLFERDAQKADSLDCLLASHIDATTCDGTWNAGNRPGGDCRVGSDTTPEVTRQRNTKLLRARLAANSPKNPN